MTRFHTVEHTLFYAQDDAGADAPSNDRKIPRSAADSGTGPDDKDISDVGPTVGPGTDIPAPEDVDLGPTTDDGRNPRTVGGPAAI